jgi:hypothetical protein
MNTFRRNFATACLVGLFLTVSGFAKRLPPKPVPPVISGGIRYSAEGDGRNQYLVAEDASTGKELWRVKVFHNHIKFWVEEDVQWVFITNLKLEGGSILVADEMARCYAVSLRQKQVKKRQCDDTLLR